MGKLIDNKNLIKESLVHWENNLRLTQSKDWKTVDYDISADSCALCKQYHFQKSFCSGCPLDNNYNCFKDSSPYKKVRIMMRDNSYNRFCNLRKSILKRDLILRIKRMIDVLKSV